MKGRQIYCYVKSNGCLRVCIYKIVIVTFFLIFSRQAYCQVNNGYDEISVTLNVQRIGSLEIPAIIHEQTIYLPVKDLFDFLKIRNTASSDYDSISGFFINPKATFLVDKSSNRIIYEDKISDLKKNDLILTENNLYLKTDYFGQVFGLECAFNFRSLSVSLTTKQELPAIREMQQELMRKNISKLKGERKVDTTIGRSFPLFHVGTADWSVMTTQETNLKTNSIANLAIGAIVAGGETNLSLNYDSYEPFNPKRQYYNWRYVNNDNSFLRQITAGKFYAQSTASIYAPVVGVQFTNTPTTYRRSFGTYTLSNTTEPGWMVELYVNNVLVNYTKADASGFFTFQVPMIYGNTVVKLRFYGPWGEERTREQNITIPFNFIPVHEFEYTVSAGIVEDGLKSKYSRANFNYGLSKHITIGSGVEYLSSVTSGKTMPFLNASVRLGSNLLVSGEHTYGVRSKGIISYRLPSNLQFDLNYTKYVKGQTAVQFDYLEQKGAVLSIPFHSKKFTAFTRLTINQYKLAKTKYTSGEFLLSTIIGGVSSNLTTYALLTDPVHPLVYSNLSLTFRTPIGIRFTPQLQYEYIQKNFSMLKCEAEKNIFKKGFLNFSYQKNMINKDSYVAVGLRYNFSFAQTSVGSSYGNGITQTTQSAKGSLLFDSKTNYVGTSEQNNVGKGGLIIAPFLDLNCNGRRDANEPKAFGLKVHTNGGRIAADKNDTTIRVYGLEAYTNYYIELDGNSFDNIAWQIKKKSLSVAINPNYFTLIEVPVAVVGEASGTVYFKGGTELKGLGRMIVGIYNQDSVLVARTLSEADGFFSYIGLAPGTYTAHINKDQLAKLHMKSSPVQTFEIKAKQDGDVMDKLQFVLEGNE